MVSVGRVSTEDPNELKLMQQARGAFSLIDIRFFDNIEFGVLQPGLLRKIENPSPADFIKVIQALSDLTRNFQEVFVSRVNFSSLK